MAAEKPVVSYLTQHRPFAAQYGGADQYNVWSFEAGNGTCNGRFECRDAFFGDRYARQLYKAHARAVMLRANTLTGVVYRDDPAIFGWCVVHSFDHSELSLVCPA